MRDLHILVHFMSQQRV